MRKKAENVTDLPQMTFENLSIDDALDREWLVTNGLGGFSSSTLTQVNTRRYHGWFVPCLPSPYGRAVMIPRVAVSVSRDGKSQRLDSEERAQGGLLASNVLQRFTLDGLIPVWEYNVLGCTLRQRIVMVYGQNTLFVTWELVEGPAVALNLQPFSAFRLLDRPMLGETPDPIIHFQGDHIEVTAAPDTPPVRMRIYSSCVSPFVAKLETSAELLYRTEKGRGLDYLEKQKSPGSFTCKLDPGTCLSFGATTESLEMLERDPKDAFENERQRQQRLIERAPAKSRIGTAARLVLAADQFIVRPQTRPSDAALALSIGEDARSVIAGYPWFTDWGRDTMISLEGLTISTGRLNEAAAILRTFSHYVRDGLLPNLFPEGGREGLYHTADATLWFFHAIHRYYRTTGDQALLRDLFPKLQDIMQHHIQGTRFGIGVDENDGLLKQGAEGYQLTWMDALVDGWVVTPRRGKAVEINALWFNALSLMATWAKALDGDPSTYMALAEKAQASFNARFWNPETACLYDVLDANDASIRPNQIFSISLDFPVLDRSKWDSVLSVVERDLLTPVGLRSLSPDNPGYKATYDGDLRARDAAYHQGTVWAWLIGHFVDARRKVRGTEDGDTLKGLEKHLREAGVGQASEIFDATSPYTPRGCYAQAWSTAELQRVWRP